jgi:hypothetical protein
VGEFMLVCVFGAAQRRLSGFPKVECRTQFGSCVGWRSR